jgi:hypothetical protein
VWEPPGLLHQKLGRTQIDLPKSEVDKINHIRCFGKRQLFLNTNSSLSRISSTLSLLEEESVPFMADLGKRA